VQHVKLSSGLLTTLTSATRGRGQIDGWKCCGALQTEPTAAALAVMRDKKIDNRKPDRAMDLARGFRR